jgi:hypothetical protein
MSLHITNMTCEPLLMTVLAGDEPNRRIIRISDHHIIFSRQPLQQQSLPTGGRDPIEVQGYENGWNIDLRIDDRFSVIATTIEINGQNQHAIAIKVFLK